LSECQGSKELKPHGDSLFARDGAGRAESTVSELVEFRDLQNISLLKDATLD
jgi:hypothetical protein